MVHIQKENAVKYKQFKNLAVVILSYVITFLFLIVTATAAILSGHGYLFGLFAVYDTVLTVGNLHVLGFLYPWNEIGFVISINLILLMGLSFLSASCYVTFHFVSGNDFNEIIQYWWSPKYDDGYVVVGQDEDGPFKSFMEKNNGDHRNEYGKEDGVKNPFLDGEDEMEYSSRSNFDSLTPDFLQNEIEASHIQADADDTVEEKIGS